MQNKIKNITYFTFGLINWRKEEKSTISKIKMVGDFCVSCKKAIKLQSPVRKPHNFECCCLQWKQNHTNKLKRMHTVLLAKAENVFKKKTQVRCKKKGKTIFFLSIGT